MRMIAPNRPNVRQYFSCGDIEILNKHASRVTLSDEELLKRIKPCQDYENKIKELNKFIGKNLEAADLKINLYVTACNKHCLSPYPSYIIEESAIGMESLVLINDFIPPVGLLKHYLKGTNKFTPNEHVINVLHWLLITFSEPSFTKTDNQNFQKILSKVEHLTNMKLPNHIFVLKYKRISEGLWLTEKSNVGSKFAFLPLSIEYAHSIVHLGVHPQIYTEGKHGLGIYLTTDINCCLECSAAQWVWGKSILGIETQLILLVEFINHSCVITYEENKALCKEQNSLEEAVNNGIFYFLPSHKFIRVRYVMLYVKTPSSMKSKPIEKFKELDVLYKRTILYLTLTLTAIILAKRVRFASIVKNIFANIASLPIVKQCLSLVL